MELILESSQGVPAGGVLSLRIGETKRQAPISKIGQPFRFGSSPAAALPVKVEVFVPACAPKAVMLDPTQQRFVIDLPGGMQIKMRQQAVEELQRPIPDVAKVAADRGLAGEKKEMATAAGAYLEKNGLVRIFQDLLHGLLVSQPEDPWAYLNEHLARAKAVATGDMYIPSPQGARQGAPEPPTIAKQKSRGTIKAESKVDALMNMLKNTRQNWELILPYIPQEMGELLTGEAFALECTKQFVELDVSMTGTLSPEEVVPIIVQLSSAAEEKLTAAHVNKFVKFFDVNKDGEISLEEFIELTQFIIIAAHMESEEGQAVAAHIQNQETRFSDFIDMLFANKDRICDIIPFLPDHLVEQLGSDAYINDCMDNFDELDTDKSNSLSPDELIPVVLSLSNISPESVNLEKIKKFISVFDVHGNGLIMRDEFVEFSQFLVVMNFLSTTVEGQQIEEAAQYTADLRHCDDLMAILTNDVSRLPEVMSFLPRSILNEISSEQFAIDCVDAFKQLDRDGNKVLDSSELYPIIEKFCEGHPIIIDDPMCKEFCDIFDADKNGTICIDEFYTICQYVVTMGYLKFTQEWREDAVNHDRAHIDCLITEMREHAERLDEVIPLLSDEVQDELTSPEFAAACEAFFDELDTNQSGSLEPANLIPVVLDLCKAHPFALTTEQCQEFISIFDTENTGVIGRKEFLNAVRFVTIMSYLESEQGRMVKGVADLTIGQKKVEDFLQMLEKDRDAIHKIIPLLPEAIFNEITSDGFVEACVDRFDELDKDKSGALEPVEIFPLIIELSEASPHSIDLIQCERFTAIFDLRGDGVIRLDEFLDFARFLTIMSYLDSEQGRDEFAQGLQILDETRQIEDLITMLESDRQQIRLVIPYLPQDVQDSLLSKRFTKSCLDRFRKLDVDNSGSLEPEELYPVVMEMLETETAINSTALDMDQVRRFTAIFDDEKTGVISQSEFVNFARFIMVMSFLKTEDGQQTLNLAYGCPPEVLDPVDQLAAAVVGDMADYKMQAEQLSLENEEQRLRLLQMEKKFRLMEERMDMQDEKLRRSTGLGNSR